MPPLFNPPSGGLDIIYKLCSNIAYRGYKVAIVFLKNEYSYPNLTPFKASAAVAATKIFFLMREIVGRNYNYSILHNIDIKFAEKNLSPGFETDKICATDWPLADAVYKHVKEHPDTEGFYLVQTFEDHQLYSGKNAKLAKEAYDLKLRKIVTGKGLYDKFANETPKPLRFQLAINEEFRNKVDMQDRYPFSVLMPLRDHESKGSKYAIEAIQTLKGMSEKYKFIAYGNMDPRDVPSYIEYHYRPNTSELADLYNKAAIFVCPSIIEGFGLPVLEAMASGCATITTDSIGIREFAVNNENSIIVPTKDPIAIANSVAKIANDAILKKYISSNGIKTAERFIYKNMYNSFAEALGFKKV